MNLGIWQPRAAILSARFLGVAALLAAGSTAAFAQEWQIDRAHSAAQFSVRHMLISTVRGQFGKLTGTARFDPAKPTASTVAAEVDVTSVDTRELKRDAHLKSADFFDAEKFPAMTFKSTKIEADGPGKYKMTGDLTIKGSTRSVTFDVEGPSGPLKDARGERIGVTATAKISRKDFGIVYNRMMEAGGAVVGDEVTITIDAELIKRRSD